MVEEIDQIVGLRSLDCIADRHGVVELARREASDGPVEWRDPTVRLDAGLDRLTNVGRRGIRIIEADQGPAVFARRRGNVLSIRERHSELC
ncbi:MAG: hypothetical protein HC909_03475 [Blastochloris sp.]|nr:hypothetical protein [Blastochloris sp.]